MMANLIRFCVLHKNVLQCYRKWGLISSPEAKSVQIMSPLASYRNHGIDPNNWRLYSS